MSKLKPFFGDSLLYDILGYIFILTFALWVMFYGVRLYCELIMYFSK